MSLSEIRKMNRILISLYLLFSFALCSQVSAGENAASRLARIAQKKAGVEQKAAELRGRIALTRSLGEFIEEVELFDNRIYGKLTGRNNQEKADELEAQLETSNARLTWMLNNAPSRTEDEKPVFDGGNENILTQDYENYLNEIQRLEGEISSMQAELGSLTFATTFKGGTEVMDGSLWLEEENRLTGSSVIEFQGYWLDYYNELLEKLKEEEDTLTEELERESGKNGAEKTREKALPQK
ncbi:MAG TPA: hypothetical protein VM123_16535 [archaeon]|nr:hypothetical protein [archaeon]